MKHGAFTCMLSFFVLMQINIIVYTFRNVKLLQGFVSVMQKTVSIDLKQ